MSWLNQEPITGDGTAAGETGDADPIKVQWPQRGRDHSSTHRNII